MFDRREYQRKWRANNRDKIRIKNVKYRDKHREQKREKERRWRAKNPDKAHEKVNRWHRANPEKVRNIQARRRAFKKGVPISNVELEAIWNRYNGICYLCGKAIDRDDCQFDHIIPLSKGGTHSDDNLRPTHSFCNKSKGNKIIRWIQAKLF